MKKVLIVFVSVFLLSFTFFNENWVTKIDTETTKQSTFILLDINYITRLSALVYVVGVSALALIVGIFSSSYMRESIKIRLSGSK